MKNRIISLLYALMLLTAAACAEGGETVIQLSEDAITVGGEAITQDTARSVYLALETQTHEDVPEKLKTLENRV